LKVVLDTCVLKLATLANRDNPSALIVALAVSAKLEWWVSPAILDEYESVLAEHPEVLILMHEWAEICHPLTVLDLVRHEPDNRFLECALAVEAEYLVTVNTARGHFDRRRYAGTQIVTPGVFVNLGAVRTLMEQ